MARLSMDHPWAFAFGILGNLASLLVYVAPIPTFVRVYRKKSTEGFHSVPYVVALFSAMLWIYYAFIKTNSYLLITINSLGCVIEIVYIIVFIMYASKSGRVHTVKLICVIDVGLFGLIVLATYFFVEGAKRLTLLGWICVGFSVSVFIAPLSIMRIVIRTKSVEFMPFYLSFFLTLSAVTWFSYGLLTKDIYVAIPNTLGFAFGVSQMILYIIYMDRGQNTAEEKGAVPEHIVDMTKIDLAPDFEMKEFPDVKEKMCELVVKGRATREFDIAAACSQY
nr:sugar transporter [Lilium sp.]